jgi:hypothetical protein
MWKKNFYIRIYWLSSTIRKFKGNHIYSACRHTAIRVWKEETAVPSNNFAGLEEMIT